MHERHPSHHYFQATQIDRVKHLILKSRLILLGSNKKAILIFSVIGNYPVTQDYSDRYILI